MLDCAGITEAGIFAVKPLPVAMMEPRTRLGLARTLPITLWLTGVLISGILAGFPATRRTQEARVLVVAREMLGHGIHAWLIPHANGVMRLQKPPLAYWLTAISFKLFGINEWTGRLPAVLAGWGTVAVTFTVARRSFGRRIALLSGVILASMWLQPRLSMLAETDVLATFFVTSATAAFWRAVVIRERSAFWFHIASAAIAGAVMSKGPPGFYPLLFLVAWPIFRRGDRPIWRWITSGAPLTAIFLGAPWWAYILLTVGYQTLVTELHAVTTGRDHGGSPLVYVPILLVAMAPWSIFTLIATWKAAARWKRDLRLRALLLWAAAVFVPLCFIGNKQDHYLLPLLPPMAILTAWGVDRALRWWDRRHNSNHSRTLILAAASAIAAALMLIIGVISPRMEKSNTRSMAATLQLRFPGRPFCFSGDGDYLPLCFALRQIVPFYKGDTPLIDAIKNQPTLVVLQQTPENPKGPPYPPLPKPLLKTTTIGAGPEHIDVYVVPNHE
jgi:4-amino-4-deoxy-L-arabinose transferase-like glycosyltransferase